MSGILFSEQTLDTVLQMIARLASQAVDSADAVSLTLKRDDDLFTAAHTAPVAWELDQAQYADRTGPCVDSTLTQSLIHAASISDEDRWPAFRDAASAGGVKTVLSLPLTAGTRTYGSLNMYGTVSHAFDERPQQLATLFAAQAAVLVANAQAYADAEQLSANLRAALESREVIGEAKGIIMERQRVSQQEAFNVLRRMSQTSNRKLRDVAAEVVRSVAPVSGGGDGDKAKGDERA